MSIFEENTFKQEETHNDYLWDASGQPDPELQKLENLLLTFRHADGAIPAFVMPVSPARENPLAALVNRLWLPCFAAAATIALVLTASTIIRTEALNTTIESAAGWNVAQLEGTPQVGRYFVSPGTTNTKLHVGQTLQTDALSRASISDDDLGEVNVDPNSRVRLLAADTQHKRIQLQLGTIHARIWAPPGQFVVDTPSATAVDLGCAYTLQVAPDGSGTIRTTLGWVGFHLHDRDSFIPAGAMCATRPQQGPGTPYFEDASPELRNALFEFDFAAPSPEARATALQTVLAQARPRDALTLWHLLSRTQAQDREHVYDRFAALVPPPSTVTREGILQLRRDMLDAWWNALDLGDIYLWRYWEQSAEPHSSGALAQPAPKKDLLLKQSR